MIGLHHPTANPLRAEAVLTTDSSVHGPLLAARLVFNKYLFNAWMCASWGTVWFSHGAKYIPWCREAGCGADITESWLLGECLCGVLMVFLALSWPIFSLLPTHSTSACSHPLALISNALPAFISFASLCLSSVCLLCGAFTDFAACEFLLWSMMAIFGLPFTVGTWADNVIILCSYSLSLLYSTYNIRPASGHGHIVLSTSFNMQARMLRPRGLMWPLWGDTTDKIP